MLCRLCLININDEKCAILLFNTYENESESLFVRLIAKYMHLDITRQDAISTIICQECCNHLNAFHKFSEFVSERQRSLLKELVEVKREVVFSRTEGLTTAHDQNNAFVLSDSTSQLEKCADVELKCEPDEHNIITEAVMPSNVDNSNQDSNQEYISTSMNDYFPLDDYDAYRHFLTQKSVNPERALPNPADVTTLHKRQRNPAYSPTFPSARLPQMSENTYLPTFSDTNNTCDTTNFTNILFSSIFFRIIKHLDSTTFQQKRGGALVQCCICDCKLKGSTQVTSNLIRHLKIKHPEEFEKYKQLKAVSYKKNRKETICGSLEKKDQHKEWQVL